MTATISRFLFCATLMLFILNCPTPALFADDAKSTSSESEQSHPDLNKLWEKIDEKELKGTIVLVPVMNVPGYLNGQREFTDGQDLNRIMPGNKSGTTSEVYAQIILEKIVKSLVEFVKKGNLNYERK